MHIDDISFNDISIFHNEEDFSIFHKLNFTRTAGGKEWLRWFFTSPFNDVKKIIGTQNIIRKLCDRVEDWPPDISNGTMMVMDRFLEYDLETTGNNPSTVEAYIYRLIHSPDYSMVKFSMRHFCDFFRGLKHISEILGDLELPPNFQLYVDRIQHLMRVEPLKQMSETTRDENLPINRNVYFAANVRGSYKNSVMELMEIYYRMDAWYSMAVAVKKYNLVFPTFVENDSPFIRARGLYHLLIHNPVPCDLHLNKEQPFLFLTGANMAGKSTLIKSLGGAVFLAHIGMGVPVREMQLTLFDGLISNINVVDNIAKGESFFFNEVQRIKNTVEKIKNGNRWLVLIDELFKGTNIQDAMRCSLAVIRGLIKVPNSLFVLSTHLYEIGEELQNEQAIIFRHFETTVTDEALSFSYQLKEGVSKDRFGYLILKREGVVEMLNQL